MSYNVIDMYLYINICMHMYAMCRRLCEGLSEVMLQLIMVQFHWTCTILQLSGSASVSFMTNWIYTNVVGRPKDRPSYSCDWFMTILNSHCLEDHSLRLTPQLCRTSAIQEDIHGTT